MSWQIDKLIELLSEIDGKTIELEEAQESGDLEAILELSLEIEDLKRQHFLEKMKETGG